MTEIRTLERRLRAVARTLSDDIRELMGDIIIGVGAEVVPRTPVDTGFARGNWVPTVGAPSMLPVSRLDPTGAGAVARIKIFGQRYTLGTTVFITNNAPYIGRLNAGSSRQAPAGFVEQSTSNGVDRGIERFRVRRSVG